MREELLIVLAGVPGTGKTTLGRLLAAHLGAAFVRIDAVEAAVARCGLASHPVGPVGYVVAQEIVASNLAVGTSVVVDAVNPVPEARASWCGLVSADRLIVFETVVPNHEEHRQRVESRQPDLAGHRAPTWDEVLSTQFMPWDEARDGPRTVIDMTDSRLGVAAAIERIDEIVGRCR